jgi:hypothetical protein
MAGRLVEASPFWKIMMQCNQGPPLQILMVEIHVSVTPVSSCSRLGPRIEPRHDSAQLCM